MSVQILIQGKLLGLDDFLTAAPISSDEVVVARSLWISLVCEVVPRALLAELELARVLLGSSGGGQFLLVLTDAVRERAEQFLRQSAAQIKAATGGHVRLVWAVTENLGDWTVVRKRLQDAMRARESAPLAQERSFAPFQPAAAEHTIFTPEFAQALRTTSAIGWSPDLPGVITTGPAKRAWPVSANLSLDGITLSRQYAHSELAKTEGEPATTAELASRATGQPAWGVLRGDVDLFGLRLRRLQSIEEHVQLSMLYKHFFAGELEVLSMGGEFFRRVNILYSGGDDFAVYGAWDALVLFAGEMQRTFHRFAEENLKEFPGAEAKTVTMAMAIAGEGQNLGQVYAQAGRDLAVAKAADKDQFVNELTRIYAKAQSVTESPADHERLLRRAYRFQRRYNRAAYSRREKEFQKLRTHLIGEIVGRNIRPAAGKQLRLRPAGVVAIEWARLSKEV